MVRVVFGDGSTCGKHLVTTLSWPVGCSVYATCRDKPGRCRITVLTFSPDEVLSAI